MWLSPARRRVGSCGSASRLSNYGERSHPRQNDPNGRHLIGLASSPGRRDRRRARVRARAGPGTVCDETDAPSRPTRSTSWFPHPSQLRRAGLGWRASARSSSWSRFGPASIRPHPCEQCLSSNWRIQAQPSCDQPAVDLRDAVTRLCIRRRERPGGTTRARAQKRSLGSTNVNSPLGAGRHSYRAGSRAAKRPHGERATLCLRSACGMTPVSAVALVTRWS